MISHIVLGAGFGDEGKGLTTDYLCLKYPNSLVVRFNGGHQAGHTVMTRDGKRHVFSNFGSGTLRGCPTYWSKYCTSEPVGFLQERISLLEMGIEPVIYVDAQSPITTPWDIAYNRARESKLGHGSVGVGFGTTIQRQEDRVSLTVEDLRYKGIRREKIRNIKEYYELMVRNSDIHLYYSNYLEGTWEGFEASIDAYLQHVSVVNERHFMQAASSRSNHVIFEGAQGILLDMDHGFFPNVTRSNTTSKNALELIKLSGTTCRPNIIYVSRAYQTRHGNGWMSNEGNKHLLSLRGTEGETNVTGDWQGNFRRSLLDIDMLRYAMGIDKRYSYNCQHSLMLTCINQIEGQWLATQNEEVVELKSEMSLVSKLGIGDFIGSNSPYAEDLLLVNA